MTYYAPDRLTLPQDISILDFDIPMLEGWDRGRRICVMPPMPWVSCTIASVFDEKDALGPLEFFFEEWVLPETMFELARKVWVLRPSDDRTRTFMNTYDGKIAA